jgi:hypothetical protein
MTLKPRNAKGPSNGRPHSGAQARHIHQPAGLCVPKFSAKERRKGKLSRTYAISQVEYCVNCMFKCNFSILERGCQLGLWHLAAHKIAEAFGTRLRRNHRGKLFTIIDQNRARPPCVPRLFQKRNSQAV